MSRQMLNILGAAAMLFFSAVSFAPKAKAQAWLPPKGQASVTTVYQFIDVGDHLFSVDTTLKGVYMGKRRDLGDIKSHSVQLSLQYGLSNRLALNAVVPWVVSRYEGTRAENPAIDDSLFRGGIQDFNFGIRYMAIVRPLVVTPFMSISIPSHHYPTVGHAAIGKDLNELHLGLYLGKLLPFFSHNLYTQAGCDFAYVERHEDHPRTNRSNIELALGYFVTSAISVGTNLAYQRTHSGIDWLYARPSDSTTFHNHDRLAKANYLDLGGSFAVNVSDALNIFVAYSRTIWGENVHEINNAVTLGTTWNLPIMRPVFR